MGLSAGLPALRSPDDKHFILLLQDMLLPFISGNDRIVDGNGNAISLFDMQNGKNVGQSAGRGKLKFFLVDGYLYHT